MCNQQGHVNFGKAYDIVINSVNTEKVIIVEFIFIKLLLLFRESKIE